MKGLFLIFLVLLVSFTLKNRLTPYQFPELVFFPKMPVNSDNIPTIEGVELGRFLFYDTILSENYSMSCASCHNQARAFSDGPKQFSKGNKGILTRRNTLPLFNLAWYEGFFWDAKSITIEEQVFHPVRDKNEMNLDWKLAVKRLKKSSLYSKKFKKVFHSNTIDSIMVSKAIGQFLRTLISYESKFDRVLNGKDYLTKDEFKGFELINDMKKGNCLHCHTTDANSLGTTGGFSNNGLDEAINISEFLDKGLGAITNIEKDYGKFKIPSLRNLIFTAPYMHDGRFETLEEVIDFYNEGIKMSPTLDSKIIFNHSNGMGLSKIEKEQIILFLKTMSDSVFVSKKQFSNPFK